MTCASIPIIARPQIPLIFGNNPLPTSITLLSISVPPAGFPSNLIPCCKLTLPVYSYSPYIPFPGGVGSLLAILPEAITAINNALALMDQFAIPDCPF